MNLYAARDLAVSLMRAHGLMGWTFAFDHARRRFGACRYRAKRITLSRHLAFLNGEEEVRDTILHEIAHALTPGDGHGEKWKRKCLEIGAKPVRCYTDEAVVSPPRRIAPYLIGCARCDWWADRHRLTRRKLVCRTCRTPVIFREKAAAPT
jgi:predicted SprT family Zn-dependent metalloprotease